MTHEVFRGDLSEIAKIYTTLSFSKLSQADKKLDSQEKLYVNKRVVKDGIQARTGIQLENVMVSVDDRLNLEYLAFLLNTSPWKVMLGEGIKYLEGISTPTSLNALKKLPIVIISKEEQSACAFLNTLITTTYDAKENEGDDRDGLKMAFHYLLGIRDNIALEILLDGVLSSPDISVLSAWMDKKAIFDSTEDKKEAFLSLFKAIFSSNDELRDRMNKMRLYIDENTDLIYKHLAK